MARARKVRAVEEARWKSASEMYKLVYDLLKHLTTLSAGASLLIMTLTEKFVKGAAFKSTLGIATQWRFESKLIVRGDLARQSETFKISSNDLRVLVPRAALRAI
jgi:hypothetical protein